MHLSQLAAANPDKPAYIMAGSGQTFTYSDLERGSNQLAQLFRSLGLVRGDHIAILLENHPLFIQICVAAQRAGLYYTAISYSCLLYTSPSPRDKRQSRMPSSA